MSRVEPCACGGFISVPDDDIPGAVLAHNRTARHLRWRGLPERTDVLLEPMGRLDAASFERMFHVLVDEVRGYVTSVGIVPARTMELSDAHQSEAGSRE